MPASLAIQPMEPTMPSVQDWRTTPLMHVNKGKVVSDFSTYCNIEFEVVPSKLRFSFRHFCLFLRIKCSGKLPTCLAASYAAKPRRAKLRKGNPWFKNAKRLFNFHEDSSEEVDEALMLFFSFPTRSRLARGRGGQL